YLVTGCDTATTSINVFFETYPAGVITMYMYYGNPDAPNGSEAANFSTPASNGPTTINKQVSASADDASQKDMNPLGKGPTNGGMVSISNEGLGNGCSGDTCLT